MSLPPQVDNTSTVYADSSEGCIVESEAVADDLSGETVTVDTS